MSTPVEHDTTCQKCGAHVPAGAPQHQLLGPVPMCEPCGKRAQENWLNYKRRQVEHNKRMRELEASDHASDHVPS